MFLKIPTNSIPYLTVVINDQDMRSGVLHIYNSARCYFQMLICSARRLVPGTGPWSLTFVSRNRPASYPCRGSTACRSAYRWAALRIAATDHALFGAANSRTSAAKSQGYTSLQFFIPPDIDLSATERRILLSLIGRKKRIRCSQSGTEKVSNEKADTRGACCRGCCHAGFHFAFACPNNRLRPDPGRWRCGSRRADGHGPVAGKPL